MPVLLNARHERFAQELAKGTTAGEAYELAGFAPSRPNASRLQHADNIRQRVAEILETGAEVARKATEQAAERLSIDREWVMSRLVENANRAMQSVPVRDGDGPTGEYKYEGSVANRALELLGKELGMFIDRKEIRTGSLDDVSDDELDQRIRAAAIAAGLSGEETAH